LDFNLQRRRSYSFQLPREKRPLANIPEFEPKSPDVDLHDKVETITFAMATDFDEMERDFLHL
jgi:hypothetical protein